MHGVDAYFCGKIRKGRNIYALFRCAHRRKNRRLERAGAETEMSAVRRTGGISVVNGKLTFTPTCWSALLNACGPRRKELQAVAAVLQGTFVSQKRQRR